jgi:hypothetical protein
MVTNEKTTPGRPPVAPPKGRTRASPIGAVETSSSDSLNLASGDGERRTHRGVPARRSPELSPSWAGERPPSDRRNRRVGRRPQKDRQPVKRDGKGTRTPTPVIRDRENRLIIDCRPPSNPFGARHREQRPFGYRVFDCTSRYRSVRLHERSSPDRVDTVMILPQVHLRKPCYDFYFL